VTKRARLIARSVLVAGTLAVLAGCRLGGSRTVEAENNRLREVLAASEARVSALEGDVSELRAKLAATDRGAALLPATLPVARRVEIGRFSGFVPRDALAPAEGFRVEVTPLDGRGRFVPVAGTLRVRVTRDGATLGEAMLDESAFREAYRSGFAGTYYECRVPLATPLTREGRDPAVTVSVELTDRATGETLRGERTIDRAPVKP
jgi:hypothetical protein